MFDTALPGVMRVDKFLRKMYQMWVRGWLVQKQRQLSRIVSAKGLS
jgi:hypothetical protein